MCREREGGVCTCTRFPLVFSCPSYVSEDLSRRAREVRLLLAKFAAMKDDMVRFGSFAVF